nr:PREDICTED: vasopressin V2 receptor isoform X1 [Latimeria chalumnae]|eukprot:XP_014345894.1 PREDICTED: vasopressin V2 receptor isoform X1 [Latimeria chalumnae]
MYSGKLDMANESWNTTMASPCGQRVEQSSYNSSTVDRNNELAKVEIAILVIIFACATLSNSVVLVTLFRHRKQNALMHIFMVNLCIADLMVAFFQVLPQLMWDITDRFHGPDFLCKAVKYLQVVGMFASSYMIMAMTFDRHQAICQPMGSFHKGGSRWNIPVAVAWVSALLLSLPQVFIFSKVKLKDNIFECWACFVEPWGVKAYVTWITLMVFIGPMVFITICQVRIFKEIYNNIYLKSERVVAEAKKLHQGSKKGNDTSSVSSAMSKTIKMTFVIVLVYTACCAPFFIVQLWSVWDPKAPKEGVTFVLLMLLASLNSCTNPWIYTAFSNSVSRELQLLLCCQGQNVREAAHPEESSCSTAISSLPKGAPC